MLRFRYLVTGRSVRSITDATNRDDNDSVNRGWYLTALFLCIGHQPLTSSCIFNIAIRFGAPI